MILSFSSFCPCRGWSHISRCVSEASWQSISQASWALLQPATQHSSGQLATISSVTWRDSSWSDAAFWCPEPHFATGSRNGVSITSEVSHN